MPFCHRQPFHPCKTCSVSSPFPRVLPYPLFLWEAEMQLCYSVLPSPPSLRLSPPFPLLLLSRNSQLCFTAWDADNSVSLALLHTSTNLLLVSSFSSLEVPCIGIGHHLYWPKDHEVKEEASNGLNDTLGDLVITEAPLVQIFHLYFENDGTCILESCDTKQYGRPPKLIATVAHIRLTRWGWHDAICSKDMIHLSSLDSLWQTRKPKDGGVNTSSKNKQPGSDTPRLISKSAWLHDLCSRQGAHTAFPPSSRDFSTPSLWLTSRRGFVSLHTPR